MTYHPDVLHGSQAPVENTEPKASTTFDEVSKCQVILIHTLTLLPDQSANVPVQGNRAQGTLFLESGLSESDLIVEDGLLEFSQSGRSGLAIANTSDHTCHVRRGTVMGSSCQATVEVFLVMGTKQVLSEGCTLRRWALEGSCWQTC